MTEDRIESVIEPESDGDRRTPFSYQAETAWYALLSVVFLVVLVAAVTTAASVSPAFCLTCHSGAGDTLALSAHATLECDACHTQAGALGLVESRMRVVSMVFSAPFTVVTGTRTRDVPIDNQKCLDCHGAMVSQTFAQDGLRMNHRAPEAEGWMCTTCHSGASHPGETYQGASYTMDQCLQCHSAGPANLSTCEACHEKGSGGRAVSDSAVTPWRVTHGANWQRTHGMGDLNTCKTCHAPDYCVACHNMQLPHAANFLAGHGKDVLGRDTGDSDCIVCHKGAACENCHGLEMPHPDGFVTEHQDASKKSPEVCERCHAQEQCDACHTRHTHPGIPPNQLELLKEDPVSVR